MKVLHIAASPRGEQSSSLTVAKEFLDVVRRLQPQAQIEELVLFEASIPEFRAPAAEAKYKAMAGGAGMNDAESLAWTQVIAVIDELKSADWIVISSPMWNYGVPYRLKQYIDVVVQPGLTFTYDNARGGYVGALAGRKTVLILSRGGNYQADGDPYDFQKPYLEKTLGLIGLSDIRSILVQPMLAKGEEAARAGLERAILEARQLAEQMAGRQEEPAPSGSASSWSL